MGGGCGRPRRRLPGRRGRPRPGWSSGTRSARVTSSASLSLGAIPTAGRQGARCGGCLQQVVDGDVQCGGEGVQVGAHRASRLDVGFATPIMGTLASSHTPWNRSSSRGCLPPNSGRDSRSIPWAGTAPRRSWRAGLAGIHQVDGDLGVLDAAGGAGVLALHPTVVVPFLRSPVSSTTSTAARSPSDSTR